MLWNSINTVTVLAMLALAIGHKKIMKQANQSGTITVTLEKVHFATLILAIIPFVSIYYEKSSHLYEVAEGILIIFITIFYQKEYNKYLYDFSKR